MAFSRHNIEKHRLIEMVRQNPILWDCRLPHYKRSDKKKDGKWCELGRAFNVTGERVQRTFTSLREIFRRELNHEKLLGDRFNSKWEYYHAMSFLKDVIRERKTRDRNGEEYASLNPKIRKWNEQADAIIRDLRLVHTPPRPANYSSRSTTSSISIKEELTDLDGDDEANGESSGMLFRRGNEVIPNKSTNADVGGPSAPSHPSQNVKNTTSSYNHTKNIPMEEEDDNSTPTIIQQTPREILYTKFGEFLSARLNTLNETVANDVMNRILLLIAEN